MYRRTFHKASLVTSTNYLSCTNKHIYYSCGQGHFIFCTNSVFLIALQLFHSFETILFYRLVIDHLRDVRIKGCPWSWGFLELFELWHALRLYRALSVLGAAKRTGPLTKLLGNSWLRKVIIISTFFMFNVKFVHIEFKFFALFINRAFNIVSKSSFSYFFYSSYYFWLFGSSPLEFCKLKCN